VKANALIVSAAALVLGAGVAHAAENAAAVDLFKRVCSTCHGAQGISISPTFPNLAGQQAEYLEVQLKAFRDRSRGDPHAQAFMWGMAAQLTDDTIKAIAAYLAAQPPAPAKPAGAAEVAAGAKLYGEGIEKQDVPACQTCHLDKAQGGGAIPRLAGQHRSYLEKQLEAFAANLRANEIMHENSKNLTALQISQVAAFLTAQ
jgi:cytochrome c553